MTIRPACLRPLLALALVAVAASGCASSPEVAIPEWDATWHSAVEAEVARMLEGRTDAINEQLPQWEHYGSENKALVGSFEMEDRHGGITRCRYYKYVLGGVAARYERAYEPDPGPFQAEQPAGRQYELDYQYVSRVELVSEIELVLLLEAEYERDGEIISTRTRRDKVPLEFDLPAVAVEYGKARFRLLKQDSAVRAGHEVAIYDENHARALDWSEKRSFTNPDQLVDALELGIGELSWPAVEERLDARIAEHEADQRTFENWARLIADQFAEE